MINWGKNTQWAGRQLTVGLTVPLAAFGKAAADALADTDLKPDLPNFKGSAGSVRFTNLKAQCDDLGGTALTARSGQSLLSVDFEFMADPQLPIPNLALVVYSADGKIVCSTGTWIDGVELTRGLDGIGRASLNFPKLPLLKGQYSLTAFLMCERAVHVYEAVEHFATVQVSQPHLEQGLFSIPHQWQTI